MKSAGPVLDQRHHRTAARQLAGDVHLASGDSGRVPAAAAQIVHQRIRADAGGAAVHQVRERLGGQAALAPVAEHHRGGRAAAQRLGLRDEGTVEEGERLRRLGGGTPGQRRHEQQGGCGACGDGHVTVNATRAHARLVCPS
jgi:hypothetical protein